MQFALIIPFVLATCEIDISAKLEGAKPTTCSTAVNATSGPAMPPKCFAIGADRPLILDLASVNPHHPVTEWRYAIRALDASIASTSGQYIDGAGRQEWRQELALPAGKDSETTFEVWLDIEAQSCHSQRTLYVERVARPEAATSWAIAGTPIHVAPDGCWREVHDRALALSLQACDNEKLAIKAVAVKPAAGVTVGQYVTNSIEAYARAGIWRVDGRKSLSAVLGEGEVLELTQTIAGDRRQVTKYFLDQQGEIVIISRYGHDRKGDSSWLVISDRQLPPKPF
jgi:hypothetical protein